jgi:hypothetical protein
MRLCIYYGHEYRYDGRKTENWVCLQMLQDFTCVYNIVFVIWS